MGGVDTNAARPDPRKAGANVWVSGGTYDPETEAKLDEWEQAKRARDFTTSEAIQAELEAWGVDTNAARPDPRKAGANPWDPWSMMNMMKGLGGKGLGKG